MGTEGVDDASADEAGAEEFTVRLPAELESARVARHRLHELLAPVGPSTQLSYESDLVLHELVVNAIVHGTSDRDGMVEVACRLEASQLLITVHDHGTHGHVAARPLTHDQPSGRGLAMVAALTSAWRVDRSDGTTVWAWLDL